MSSIQLVYAGAALACVFALLLGLLMGRRGRQPLHAEIERLRAGLARKDAQARENTRKLAKLRGETAVASLALSLPAVVRELNRSNLTPREVPQLIMHLATAIFHPGVILFYVLRTVREGSVRRKELHLAQHHGLPIDARVVQRIPLGKGKIGWVAQNCLDMLREDWLTLTRTDGLSVPDNHTELNLEIIGPLMHQSPGGEKVLGVLCLGALGTHPKNEKLMFQMVTNLGSLALVNASNVSRLREQANHDGLTGLLNKRFFLLKMAEMVVAAEKEAQPLSLFIFDIDHFKTYNDTNGHPAGDELLRSLAGLIRETIRPEDCACRYGGEEFLILMPQTDGEQAMELAEKIRSTIENHRFAHQEKQPNGNLTISGGVASFPREGESQDNLIENADQALYESKRGGRNRVTRARATGIGNHDDLGIAPIDMPETSRSLS